jgi:hypothetical protein
MFRRSRSAGDEPKANQLSGAAEPNVLKVTKPGKSGEKDATEWAWTADGMTPLDADADAEEFDEEDEEDKQAPIESAEELQAELQRQAEEFGLTGDNPVGLYGPNGEEVAALLDSLADIDDETAEQIADAYESIPEAERRVAQSVIRRRHRNGKYAYELDLAERGVTDWISSLGLEGSEGEMYSVVAAAATDAVYALILEDELADADFDTLYGAWSEVMDVEDDDDSAEDGGAATEPVDASDQDASDQDAAPESQDGPFGPNTELVTQFLEKLASLEAPLIATLVSTWRNQPKEELKQAHRALQEIADEEKLWREQLRAAQEEVFAWMDLRTTSYMEHFASSKDDAPTRESAGPVVADAVAALVMADVLTEEDAAILYAPWAEAIGVPEMPAYEDADDEK